MEARTEITRVALAPRGSLLLEDAAGVELSCRQGCVWLTQYGDSRDIVLQPGQSFVPTLPSVLAMAATGPAELVVRRPTPASSPATAGGWLRRLADLLDPRWSGRVQRELAERIRMHRVA